MIKRVKMTAKELSRARAFIRSVQWTFAKSMPQWPHSYVLRKEVPSVREYKWFLKLIEQYGYEDSWNSWWEHYLVIGSYKYWGWDDGDGKGGVINRAVPIKNDEVKRRGQLWLSRNKKIVGPYGRPIAKRYFRRQERIS